MNRKLLALQCKWFLSCVLLLCSLIPLAQTSRFVSLTGNDSHPGTLSQPWRTIQKAADNAPAGSTVYIMGGTYIEEVVMNVSGSPGAYTVFRNYDGNPVILSGNGQPAVLMQVNGVSYVEVRGLQFRNCLGSVSAGIQVLSGGWRGPAHHIRLIGNSIKNLYASADTSTYPPGVFAGAISVAGYDADNAISHVLIDSNDIADCRTGWTEAIGITGNVDTFIVSNNTVTNTGNIGIDASGHWGQSSNPATDFARNGIIRGNHVSYCRSLVEGGTGIYLDGSSGMLVEQNTVHHNAFGLGIGCEQVNNTVGNNIIRNNISYANDGYGIGVAGWSPENRIIQNCSIINNTCFGNGQKEEFRYLGELSVFHSKNLLVKNNIFYATNGSSDVVYINDNPVNLHMENNIYYTPTPVAYFNYLGTAYNGLYAYRAASGTDNNSSFLDPMFVSAAAMNFQLQGSSACIDATDPGYVPAPGEKDRDGNTRKQGIAVDNGAYEYAGGKPGGTGGYGETRFLNAGIVSNAGTVVHAGMSTQTYTNNGTYAANTGIDIFAGPGGNSGAQEISGSNAPAFGTLKLNNGLSAPFHISNNNGISVNQQLTLQNGITTTEISRHQNGAIRLADNVTITATTGSNRHINGYITKTGNDAFSFPIGNGSQLRSLHISAPSSTSTAITAAWISGSPATTMDPSDGTTHPISGSALGGAISSVYSEGSWDWISNRTHSNTLTITVTLPNLSGFSAANGLRLVGWNGTQWIALSNTATASGNTTGSTLQGFISPDSNYTALAIGKINLSPRISNAPASTIAEIGDQQATVFPNPTQNELQVRGVKKGETVLLIDMQGRQLSQTTGNGGILNVSLSRLSKGSYIIRIEDRYGSLVFIKKILKL